MTTFPRVSWRTLLATGLAWLVAGAVPALAQQAKPAARPAAPRGGAVEAPRLPPPAPQGYTYNPEGRRDPFVNLLNRGVEQQKIQAPRPDGLPGVAVSDVAVKGIIATNGAYLGMVQAPDGKTYLVRGGEKLYDANVKAVLADAIVFVQQVNDPLSLVKQREIRKPLRPTEEGR